MKFIASLSSLFVLALLGCGEVQRTSYEAKVSVTSSDRSAIPPPARRPIPPSPTAELGQQAQMSGMMAGMMMSPPAKPGQAQVEKAVPSALSPAMSRKIIYDAQVDLIVEDVDPIARRVVSLVQDARGYIAEQNTTGSPGSTRATRWKIRVPVDQFESFLQSVIALGELEHSQRTSQDVTEQYYDIEARIKNKKAEEKTLTKILEERSGKLEEVLKVEVELSRVRGEIEQLEGKIRLLENLSALATLTLNVREREKYTPAPPVVADFPTQIARTWSGSIQKLTDLGKAVVLWAVDWAIWIPLLLAAAILAWIILRILIRLFIRNLPRLITLARTPINRPGAPTPSD